MAFQQQPSMYAGHPQQSMYPGQGGYGGMSHPGMGGDVGYEMTLYARNLDKMDSGIGAKSDPFLQVMKRGPSGKEETVFKSEVVKKNLNPHWETFTITASEAGGPDNPLVWNCFDWDPDGDMDFIGNFTASLNQMAKTKRFDFINPNKKAKMFKKATKVAGELHVASCKQKPVVAKAPAYAYRVRFRANKLDRKDGAGLGSSDPYLIIRKTVGKYRVPIAKTEVVKKNLNPTWEELEIPIEPCGGETGKIIIECFDWDSDGTHDGIGVTELQVRDLTMKGFKSPLINPKKKGNFGYKNSGTLEISSCTIISVMQAPTVQPAGYEVHFSATEVARMDGLMGKSDPFLVISREEGKSRTVICKTEYIKDTLSPVWKPIQISVAQCRGLDGIIEIECYDKDPNAQELIGSMKTTLRELTMKISTFHLKNPKKEGNLGYKYSAILHVNSTTPLAWVQQSGVYSMYNLRLAAKDLSIKDMMSRSSDPYFLAYAEGGNKDDSALPLHKSQWLKKTLNPQWQPFLLEVGKCGGPEGKLRIEVWDHDDGSNDDFIGKVVIGIQELVNCKGPPEFPLIDPKREGNLGYKSSGLLRVFSFEPAPNAMLISGAPPAGSFMFPAGGNSMYPGGGPPGGVSHYPPHHAQQSYYPPGPQGGSSHYPPPQHYPPPPQHHPGSAPPGPYPPGAQGGGYYAPPPQQGSQYPPHPQYPPQGSYYPPPGGYPPQQPPQGSYYPPQGAPRGMPGYPQQSGYPPQQSMYGGQQGAPGGYSPQNYPQQQRK